MTKPDEVGYVDLADFIKASSALEKESTSMSKSSVGKSDKSRLKDGAEVEVEALEEAVLEVLVEEAARREEIGESSTRSSSSLESSTFSSLESSESSGCFFFRGFCESENRILG